MIASVNQFYLPFWVCLIWLSGSFLVDAFSTNKCDHDRLADEVRKLTTCTEKSLAKQVDEFLKNYKEQMKANDNVYDVAQGCEMIKKMSEDLQPCSSTYLNECFDDKIVQLFQELESSFQTASFCNADFNPQSVVELQNDLESKMKSVLGTVPQDYFSSIIKTDKNCKSFNFLQSLNMENKECASAYQTTSRNIKELQAFFMGVGQFPKDFSLCSTIDNALDSCMVENRCFSEQEMDLIKDVLLVQYKIIMDTIISIKNNFGTVENMLESLGKTKIKIGDRVISEPGQTKKENIDWIAIFRSFNVNTAMKSNIAKMVETFINDYKTRDCQGKVNSGQHLKTPILLLIVCIFALFL